MAVGSQRHAGLFKRVCATCTNAHVGTCSSELQRHGPADAAAAAGHEHALIGKVESHRVSP